MHIGGGRNAKSLDNKIKLVYDICIIFIKRSSPMKKVRIIAVILAAITVATLALSFNASAATFEAELDGKVDVLNGVWPTVWSPNDVTGNSSTQVDRFTDNIIASDSEEAFYNKAWCGKNQQNELCAIPGTYEFTLTDSSKKSYYWTINFDELNCDASSFSIWYSSKTMYDETTAPTEFPIYHIASQFDILVSQDNGATWTIAWQSVEYKLDEAGNVAQVPGMTKDNGGNAEFVYLYDTDGVTPVCCYKVIAGEFNQEYKGVTNIAYGVVSPRRNGSNGVVDSGAFYYADRMAEFDVYGTQNKVETTEGSSAITTAPETTKAAEVTTKAPETTKAAETTNAPETTKAAETKSGCGSVAAIGVAVVVATLGTAIIRKKH